MLSRDVSSSVGFFLWGVIRGPPPLRGAMLGFDALGCKGILLGVVLVPFFLVLVVFAEMGLGPSCISIEELSLGSFVCSS